jgi:hypothetical protein
MLHGIARFVFSHKKAQNEFMNKQRRSSFTRFVLFVPFCGLLLLLAAHPIVAPELLGYKATIL